MTHDYEQIQIISRSCQAKENNAWNADRISSAERINVIVQTTAAHSILTHSTLNPRVTSEESTTPLERTEIFSVS